MLMETLAKKLYLLGAIESDEIELVSYGLEHLILNVFSIFLVWFIGFIFDKPLDALIMWLAIFPLRKNAGGFHAETRIKCFLISFGIIYLVFFLLCKTHYPDNQLWMLGIASWIVIYAIAPVECENKRLDNLEKKEYQKRTRIILLIEAAILGVCYILNGNVFVNSVLMCWEIVAITLLAGKFKLSMWKKH